MYGMDAEHEPSESGKGWLESRHTQTYFCEEQARHCVQRNVRQVKRHWRQAETQVVGSEIRTKSLEEGIKLCRKILQIFNIN